MKTTFAKRGFVTIATGEERYYILARNLLRSYRLFSDEKIPFAIICDRINEYTEEFDNVIVVTDPSNNYNDKLKLFREIPYDETIFIDADSLAYSNLNKWWKLFEKQGDFSLFGYAWRDLNSGRGWFNPEGMKEFQENIKYIPDFNGGVYYLRNTEACKKVFDIACHCAEHYHEYSFNGFNDPANEPVLALGMAACGFEPLDKDGELIFAPSNRNLDADISVPRAIYRKVSGNTCNYSLIHFSNYRTQLSLYRREVKRMEECMAGRKVSKTFDSVRYLFLKFADIFPFGKRVFRKAKKIIKQISQSIF